MNYHRFRRWQQAEPHYVTHCINKRTYRNNNKEIISNL